MKAIRNNEARLVTIGGDPAIVLMPGENMVEDQAWDKAKKIAVVRHMLAAKQIEEVRTIAAATPAEALSKLSPAQAAKLVGETNDLALLGEWQKVERRAPVVEAIKAQIEIVNAQGKAQE